MPLNSKHYVLFFGMPFLKHDERWWEKHFPADEPLPENPYNGLSQMAQWFGWMGQFTDEQHKAMGAAKKYRADQQRDVGCGELLDESMITAGPFCTLGRYKFTIEHYVIGNTIARVDNCCDCGNRFISGIAQMTTYYWTSGTNKFSIDQPRFFMGTRRNTEHRCHSCGVKKHNRDERIRYQNRPEWLKEHDREFRMEMAQMLSDELERDCEHCGERFRPVKQRTAKYCSTKCRVAAHRQKKREEKLVTESGLEDLSVTPDDFLLLADEPVTESGLGVSSGTSKEEPVT